VRIAEFIDRHVNYPHRREESTMIILQESTMVLPRVTVGLPVFRIVNNEMEYKKVLTKD